MTLDWLKPLFEIIKSWLDPENKKERKLEKLYGELIKLQKERDRLLALPNNQQDPVRLGVVINGILRLRAEIRNLEK